MLVCLRICLPVIMFVICLGHCLSIVLVLSEFLLWLVLCYVVLWLICKSVVCASFCVFGELLDRIKVQLIDCFSVENG